MNVKDYNLMPENLVILGDCASNGSNCLASEVLGDDNAQISFSLLYHNMHNHITKWYMKKRSEGVYKNPITTSLLEHESLKAYNNAEMKVSWPFRLDTKVYNYSWNGNAFQGYLSDLKKHIMKYGKPQKVAVCCYSPDHVYVRVNSNKEKYEGIVYKNWLNRPYNPVAMSYSEGIYKQKQKYGKKEYSKNQYYLNRKAYHAWYWLKKFLRKNDIDYFCIRYRTAITASGEQNKAYELFENEKLLDLCDLHTIYNNANGDKSKLKLEYQPIIADKVTKFLKKDL
tara:strand:+ start:1018 stop:1866 length:849 start_codon:yes stop_codon:yes gene_type:complete